MSPIFANQPVQPASEPVTFIRRLRPIIGFEPTQVDTGIAKFSEVPSSDDHAKALLFKCRHEERWLLLRRGTLFARQRV